jgi:hypothetical protein
MSKKRPQTPPTVAEAAGPHPGGRGGPFAAPAPAEIPDAFSSAASTDQAAAYSVPGPGEEAVVRRTAGGWRVGDDELPDLTCAMVLADLLAAELPTEIQPAIQALPDAAPAAGPAAAQAGPRHARPGAGARALPLDEEAHRLRTTVGQLEHALTARIRIEQAIGVLAERHRIRPRQAFEQLRSAARNRGRRVIDIASDVVASATNPLLQLPEELSRQRSAPRHAARNPRRPAF